MLESTGKKQRVVLDGDKNMRHIKCEVVTKRLTAILKEQLLGLDFLAKRKQGQVCHIWFPSARVTDIGKVLQN